jgi:hypothetical protein
MPEYDYERELIKPQSVRCRGAENPEDQQMCGHFGAPKLVTVQHDSNQGSGQQTPPEQRGSVRTPSSDALRCKEDYSMGPSAVTDEQLMPPPRAQPVE